MNTHPNVTITGYTSIPAGEYRSRSTVRRARRTRSFSLADTLGGMWRRMQTRRIRPIGEPPISTGRRTRIEHSRFDAQFRSF